ncbi:hypothetical protein ILYODFUR_034686 [Ilyodon furcidens]|uniref:Uncharacterized protein n=1 Tax=Ilyodon furcidens TaxID=33524 RepID=A0ABV0TT17_9TELE
MWCGRFPLYLDSDIQHLLLQLVNFGLFTLDSQAPPSVWTQTCCGLFLLDKHSGLPDSQALWYDSPGVFLPCNQKNP